tara:strand:- start:2168 stop:2509 length:342 start_codon:yes stop_codon:yes gene_type:complete
MSKGSRQRKISNKKSFNESWDKIFNKGEKMNEQNTNKPNEKFYKVTRISEVTATDEYIVKAEDKEQAEYIADSQNADPKYFCKQTKDEDIEYNGDSDWAVQEIDSDWAEQETK